MALNNKTVVMPLQCPDFRPHLIEAIVNWCENRGQTPYMLVEVDDACDVPRHLANPDNTMVFCISEEAVNNFVIDDEAVGESISNIYIPLNRVAAVYPKEDTNLVTYFPVTPTPEKKVKKDEPTDFPVFTKV
jgi:stringent starvation protein B